MYSKIQLSLGRSLINILQEVLFADTRIWDHQILVFVGFSLDIINSVVSLDTFRAKISKIHAAAFTAVLAGQGRHYQSKFENFNYWDLILKLAYFLGRWTERGQLMPLICAWHT